MMYAFKRHVPDYGNFISPMSVIFYFLKPIKATSPVTAAGPRDKELIVF